MNDQLYSAEEAAQILGLQVRTVRNYVREGRLPGVRIGKQYRIARPALEAFAGTGAGEVRAEPAGRVAGDAVASREAVVDVSSIVVIDGFGAAAAARMTRMLEAMTSGGEDAAPRLRVETLYDEQRSRFKVLLTGSAAETAELLRVIDALTDGGPRPVSSRSLPSQRP